MRHAIQSTVATWLARAAMVFVLLVSARAMQAADQPAVKTPAKSLDDQLLEGLDNELLDDAGETATKKTTPKSNAKTAGDDAVEPSVIDGEDIGAAKEDPLTRVGRQMRAVEGLIEQLKAKQETSDRQQRIVTDLDKIIEQLQQQCDACKNAGKQKSDSQKTAQRDKVKQPGKGGKPGGENPSEKPSDKPADSTDRLGKDDLKKVDMEQMKGLLKDLWGQLPLRDREQMLQSSPEQFLPKYELLIEKYYKRLADQQSKKQ